MVCLIFYGTQAHLLGVGQSHLRGFMNFVDNKLLSVTKSFIDKLLNKLVEKCFRIDFFKLACSLKKFMACVNITQLQSSISLEMFIICLNNAIFFLLILTFVYCHVTNSSVFSITLFHSIPHVLIFSKYRRGTNQMSFLGYSIVSICFGHMPLGGE